MNWYKISKDFSDRNTINHKIMYLEYIKDILTNSAKLVFQSAKNAKKNSTDIISSKKISSYPTLENIIFEMEEIAYDNPYKYASLCSEAIKIININLSSLKEEREDFTENKKKRKFEKGL